MLPAGGRRVRIENPASSVSLVDWLFEEIRDRILTWEYAPNDLLGEKRIATEFEVSRTPVREALALLSQEGLIEVIPRVGYRVSSFSLQDIHEIFDMRLLLEGEAASRAAMNATDDELEALSITHREWAHALKQHPVSAIDYLRFHDAFHIGIAELAASQRLARAIGQLLREGTRLRMSDPLMSNLGLESEEADSIKLIEALRAGDAERARRLQQEHIGESKRRALRWLVERGGGSGVSL